MSIAVKQINVCKLCGSISPLKNSHIIPKFVGRWIKETSITPYFTCMKDVNKRLQDLSTMKLLCGSCEIRFSKWESKFAKELFYPIVGESKDIERIHKYEHWFVKFVVSLAWRAIHSHFEILQEKNTPSFLIESLQEAEVHFSKFLLDEEESLSLYTQHLFLSGDANLYLINSPMLYRYLARSVDSDILYVTESSDIYIYIH